MKINESEVILIVVLVLIGFVLYRETGGAMKTTRVRNDDENIERGFRVLVGKCVSHW